MKKLRRVIYIVLIHVLAIAGVGAIVWSYNHFSGWNKASKAYSKNITKISKGMHVQEARSIMGEFGMDEKYHAKVSYQRRTSSNDTTFVIVLSYNDGDHTDGSPVLFINPETARVEGIQLGIVF
jgi:hypothetical protein